MATSDGPGERALRYLTSRKHLVGTAGGLVGVSLAFAGLYAAEEATRLRADLAGIAERVHAAAGELPPGSSESFGRVESKLADMLGHPNALADSEVLHVLSTTVRKDLDQIVGTYLALPTHLRGRTLPARDRTAGEELLHQLRLLDDYLTETSRHLFRSHTQDIVNLITYLESRGPTHRDALE